jgi:hypothetical protein
MLRFVLAGMNQSATSNRYDGPENYVVFTTTMDMSGGVASLFEADSDDEEEELAPVDAFVSNSVFDSSSAGAGVGAACAISMEDFVDGDNVTEIRVCGHRFKTQPLMDWFARRNRTCPCCRRNIANA